MSNAYIDIPERYHTVAIAELCSHGLNTRVSNALERQLDYLYLKDLQGMQVDAVEQIHNIGPKGVENLLDALTTYIKQVEKAPLIGKQLAVYTTSRRTGGANQPPTSDVRRVGTELTIGGEIYCIYTDQKSYPGLTPGHIQYPEPVTRIGITQEEIAGKGLLNKNHKTRKG